MKSSILFIITALIFLGGCSMFGGKKEVNPPTKLEPYSERVTLNRVWKASSGEITNNNRQVQPILVDTNLYTASSEGTITAFDAETGNKLWSRKLKVSLSAGVGYGDGLLLAGTEDGEVIALYASNGNPAWVGDVQKSVSASPEGGQNVVVVPTAQDNLIGLSATDGSQLWSISESTPRLLLRGRGRPLVVSDVVLAGFDNGKMILIALSDGQRLWEVRVGDAIGKTEIERLTDVDARPVIIDQTVYTAAYQSRVIAIDAPTAKMVWENDISTNKDMDVDEKFLYIVGEGDIVYALDQKSGEIAWEQDKLAYRILTPPAVLGNYIMVGDSDGYIHLLNSATGEIEGREKVGDAFLSQPVTRGQTAWIQTLDGDVIAWQLSE